MKVVWKGGENSRGKKTSQGGDEATVLSLSSDAYSLLKFFAPLLGGANAGAWGRRGTCIEAHRARVHECVSDKHARKNGSGYTKSIRMAG